MPGQFLAVASTTDDVAILVVFYAVVCMKGAALGVVMVITRVFAAVFGAIERWMSKEEPEHDIAFSHAFP
jgi:hypothetical protein